MSLSLQDELDNMDDEDEEFEESNSSASTARSSAESEAVNWEGLQKKEDQESKDQDSDNVSSLVDIPTFAYGYSRWPMLTNYSSSVYGLVTR